MRSVSLRLLDMKHATIPLGFEGENDFTVVRIDCKTMFDQHPTAATTLAVTDPAGNQYPAVVVRDGDIIEWTVSASDLTATGSGEIQLIFTIDGTVIGNSDIAKTRVMRSITPSGETPSGITNFIQQAGAILEEVDEAIPTGGTEGQVLAKKSDADHDLEWVDQTGGGGGGTSNYNDLSNKPKIAGTTLSGNKSLHDLGIAAEAAIPDVSGKADKVAGATNGNFASLDSNGNLTDSGKKASDFATPSDIPDVSGFYTKPSGGIPSSDMSSAVQSSLGKADSAYQKPSNGIPAEDIKSGVIPDVSGFYTKPSGGIPSTDMASAVQTSLGKADSAYQKPQGGIPASDIDPSAIPSPTSIIDDNAGEGDTDKVLSADKVIEITDGLSEAIAMLGGNSYSEAVSFPNNTNINNEGTESASQYYVTTDYIDLENLSALCYTGYNGSTRAVHWYDDEKTYIGMSVYPDYAYVYDLNVLTTRPVGAAFVRVSANKSDDRQYSLTAYYGSSYNLLLLKDVVGDGVTDDTEAFQRLVNCGDPSELDSTKIIRITSPIKVRLDSAKYLNGNNVKIIVDGNFYAFSVLGSCSSNASPNNVDANVMNCEAGTVIENFRITSSDGASGGGIEVSKSFKLTIANNYIYKMANGIRVYGVNRDMEISNNKIYAMMSNGLLFDEEVNLHQCNIGGNFISYAIACVKFNLPDAIANFQITGNDIEIATYPTGYANAKCIDIVAGSGTQQLSEIEICGNSIQGHSVSGNLINLVGYSSSMPVANVSITGNHISNSDGTGIHMENCENISITGNTYQSIATYVYDMDETCGNILIVGDVGRTIGTGKIHAASTATLSNIKCKNTIFTTHDTNNIETSSVTNVDVDNDVPGSGVSF